MSTASKIKNMAWFEKYRAKNLDEYIFPDENIEKFAKEAYENEMIPGNTLFYGKPGTGKTNLAKILMNRIIKNAADLFVIKERSVKEIDEIKLWIQKPPHSSKQKIVICEEADRLLQSKQAIAELKTITERYIPQTIFLFITNYISKFASADNALLTRFTFKFQFNTLPVDKVFERVKYILTQEKIEFNEEELYRFVKDNINKGLRDLINTLQILSSSGKFEYNTNVNIKSITVEDEIVELFKSFINTLIFLPAQEVKNLLYVNSIYSTSQISTIYANLITILQNDTLIDYEYILDKLLEEVTFIPFYKVILEYLETLNMKKYKNLHLIALLYDLIKVRYEFTNIP